MEEEDGYLMMVIGMVMMMYDGQVTRRVAVTDNTVRDQTGSNLRGGTYLEVCYGV